MGQRDRTVPSTRRLLLIGGLGAVMLGLSLWLWRGYGLARWPVASFGTSVGACFVGAGLIAWRLRPRSRTGLWMIAFGLVYLIDNLNTGLQLSTEMPGREVTVLVGTPASWFLFAIGAHLFLAYPTGRLNHRAERWIVTGGFLIAAIGSVLLLLTKTPLALCEGWCGPSPVQLVADPDLYLGIRSAVIVAVVALGAVVLILLAQRAIRATPRQRRVLGLMIGAAGLTIVLVVASQLNLLAIYAGGAATSTPILLDIVTGWAAVAAVPAAFLIGLLRERLAFASVGSLVGQLERVPADEVEAVLGEVLRDPTLRVAYPAGPGLRDVSGEPFEPPDDDSRAVTPLGDPPIAVLVHDAGLAEDREILDAAAAATRLALENARLHAEVRGQLAEVRASRQRVAAAADAERLRLERDLHDGAQQRLLGVGLALGALRGRLTGPDRHEIDQLERELSHAIGELRDLAHGIRPAILTDQGLEPALAGLIRRAGVQVTADVRVADRLDPMIEATAYYVVSEALQNVVKHAGDACARVSASLRADVLAIDITDDGPGGASMVEGSGLRGLADRVDAVGGRFDVRSPPGRGTHIHVELPGGP